jgi:hypothetical protein
MQVAREPIECDCVLTLTSTLKMIIATQIIKDRLLPLRDEISKTKPTFSSINWSMYVWMSETNSVKAF